LSQFLQDEEETLPSGDSRKAGKHAPPRRSYAAVLSVFCLGFVFGIGVRVLRPLESVTALLILVVTVTAIILLRRLRERTDEQLLAGDISYRELFENALEGIFRTTPTGHYLDVNPALARIYGYESPEALKHGLTDISSQLYVDPHRREEFKAVMRENDEVADFVSEIRRRDGTKIWIKENARAVRDWSGRIVCYQGTVEDVTAKFAAERAIKRGLQRAEEANRTKNAFLAMMSHELKTPLNAIIGFSEMIQREMLGPIRNKAYAGYIEDIHASGNRLLGIINDVLDVARLEGAAIVLNKCQCCPLEIAEIALQGARRMTGDTREIVMDIADGLGPLYVDRTRLAQVLANILSNALKFTPGDGEVKLRANRAADGSVQFAVSDSGIGMSAETIAMVLQPFRQADASLARKFEGAGLGLPIAHALTELHGGSLTIVSHEGRGTTVTVELPRACVWGTEESAVA
jgi:PAS domain S-box-containing protein